MKEITGRTFSCLGSASLVIKCIGTGPVTLQQDGEDIPGYTITAPDTQRGELWQGEQFKFNAPAEVRVFIEASRAITLLEKTLPVPRVSQDRLKVLSFGDSMTSSGSNANDDGSRLADQSLINYHHGYWVAALNVLCKGDYLVRPDQGVGGDTTTQMLARIANVTSSDADLVLMLAGTNDVGGANMPTATSVANIDAIVAAILAAGKKMLIVPVIHRRDNESEHVQRNRKIDAINAHYQAVAANSYDIDIVPAATEYDRLIVSDDDWEMVSDDKLHPNNYGAMLLGQVVADALDKYYPSHIDKTNVLPAFSGINGTINNNATGKPPDDWRGSYTNPASGVGFSVVERDGKIWAEVKTSDAPVPVLNEHRCSLFNSPSIESEAGRYVVEAVAQFDHPELLSSFVLQLDSTGSTYGAGEFRSSSTKGQAFKPGVKYKIKFASAQMEAASTMKVTVRTAQLPGVDAVCRVTDIKVYKVEG